jgi:hypothetical protein
VDPGMAEAYNNLLRALAETANRIEKRQLALDGLNELDVVNRPRVLPMKATPPVQSKTIQFSFLAMLAMGFVLLLFVIIEVDPEFGTGV